MATTAMTILLAREISRVRATAASLTLLCLLASSCALPDPSSELSAIDDPEYDRIVDALVARGLDPTDLRITGDELLVEGDMELSKTQLLAERDPTNKAYTNLNSGTLYGQKDYWITGLACVRLESLSEAWSVAFREAIATWAAAGVQIKVEDLDCRGSSSLIRVFYADLGANGTFASGAVPSEGWGRRVRINRQYTGTCSKNGNIEGLQPSVKKLIAMHELGHNMGFMHPLEGEHIAGTNSGTSYNTVMAQGCFGRTALGSDDVNAISVIWRFPWT